MEHKSTVWWVDFALVCAVLLLAESARGVVIGTLSLYLDTLGGDEFFLGIVVSAFSLGRLIASFAFGALADFWSTRAVLLLSTVACMAGNFMFCMAGSLASKWVLLFSRVLTGFGTGMLSVARTHVSVTTPGDERTLWMSWLGIVQFVGFAVTPVLGNVNVRVLDLGFFLINSYTFATLLLLLLEVLVFVLLFFFMSHQSAGGQASKDKEAAKVQASATQVVDVNGNELESDTLYHELSDGQPDLDAQRLNTEYSDEDEKAVYLEGELHKRPADVNAAGAAVPTADWAPHETTLAMPVHDLSTYSSQAMEARRGTSSSLEALQQRDVIVYMESKTPTGHATMYTPHHFIFAGDPNDATNPPTLIATSAPSAAFPSLLPTSQPPTSPTNLQARASRLWKLAAASYVPLVFVMLNLSGRGTLSVAEAFGTKLYNEITAPDGPSPGAPVSASTFFLIMGCMGLLVFLLMNRLVQWVEETNLLILSFISMGIGFGVVTDLSDDDIDLADFTAGMTLVWVIGTPISQTLSVSMLSKHFSQQQKAGVAATRGVGFWMGLVTASGSVGRIVFPLIAGALPLPSATLFASLAAFCTIPVIFFPLKAYKPYLPWLRDRLSCLLPAEEEEEGGPHRMLRTSSNGDRTEMLMVDGAAPAPASVSGSPRNELLSTGASVGSTESSEGTLLSSQPMLFFVPSQAQPDTARARERTPLVTPSLRGSSLYYTAQTPINSSGGDTPRR